MTSSHGTALWINHKAQYVTLSLPSVRASRSTLGRLFFGACPLGGPGNPPLFFTGFPRLCSGNETNKLDLI